MPRRRPRPGHQHRLALTGPRRYGDRDGRNGLSGCPPELKMRAQRNGEAHAGRQGDDFLPPALAAPHLAVARHDKSDFLDRAVCDGAGGFSGGQFEVRHAASR